MNKSLALIRNNKKIIILIIFYLLIALSQLAWGIPNNNHPFSYHMDEWAQAQSLRTTFRYGTPHIWGGGNGTMFFYIQSGILLVPFVLLRVVNPFLIKSSILFINEQHRLFEVLRLQSILYGVGSIIAIAYIAKRFFKASGFIAALFMAITPVFLIITTYYRYDAPVVFWILLSLLFSFRYFEKPTMKNFFLSGIISALTVTVKISSLPLCIIYVFSFFLFTPQWNKKYIKLLAGIAVFAAIFIIAGIPDALVSFKVFANWVYYTTFSVPNYNVNNISLGMSYILFFLFFNYPSILGHFFYYFFVICLFIWIIGFFSLQRKEKFLGEYKKEIFLVFSFAMFFLSILGLKISGVGNRLLVVLPYVGIISTIIIQRIFYLSQFKLLKRMYIVLFSCIILLQIIDSLAWVSIKWFPDPRESSSSWIRQYIPKGSAIAIEAVPIFQDIPDILLKDYYTKQYIPKYQTRYNYDVIDGKTKSLPSTVIVTNDDITLQYVHKSEKRDILRNLKQQGYKKIITFMPQLAFYNLFHDERNFNFSGLSASPYSISVYEKLKKSKQQYY